MKTRTLNRMEKSSSLGFSPHCAERPSSRMRIIPTDTLDETEDEAAIQSRAVPCYRPADPTSHTPVCVRRTGRPVSWIVYTTGACPPREVSPIPLLHGARHL